jgi:very-short-patch-repair endonuclease
MPAHFIETDWAANIHVQHPVGTYRLDFAIHLSAQADGRSLSQWFAIECDGHDFHEKTKEQAQRDKARDRFLTAEGFKILRFTGTEIYADVNLCITEIFSAVERAHMEWKLG